MPESKYVFESGDPIFTGSHGSHDYVYHSGDPVPDYGQSSLVFESGTGLGGLTITAKVSTYSVSIVDNAVDIDSLKWRINGSDKGTVAYYDDAKHSDGTVFDDFSDGDISEYSGDTEYYTVENQELKGQTDDLTRDIERSVPAKSISIGQSVSATGEFNDSVSSWKVWFGPYMIGLQPRGLITDKLEVEGPNKSKSVDADISSLTNTEFTATIEFS